MRESSEAAIGYRNPTVNPIFKVTEVPGLNLLRKDAIEATDITFEKFFLPRAQLISSADIDRDL